MVFRDVDGSGGMSGGDSDFLPMCFDSEPVVALWLPQPQEIETAWGYINSERSPGWVATLVSSLGSDLQILTDAEARSLVVEPSCVLE